MNHQPLRRGQLLLLLATLLLSACATSSFKPPISSYSKPEANKAYLYGKFHLDGISEIHARTNNYPSIGLRFICDGDTEFTVGLAPREADQVVEVPAQLCSLKTLTFTNAMSGRAMGEKPYTGGALQNVRFSAGTLHYAGDVAGKFWTERGNNMSSLRWRVEEHVNRFAETSARILADRPALAALPRLDITGMPATTLARTGS